MRGNVVLCFIALLRFLQSETDDSDQSIVDKSFHLHSPNKSRICIDFNFNGTVF
jgi:hypothetical protein